MHVLQAEQGGFTSKYISKLQYAAILLKCRRRCKTGGQRMQYMQMSCHSQSTSILPDGMKEMHTSKQVQHMHVSTIAGTDAHIDCPLRRLFCAVRYVRHNWSIAH